ncbi:MAG: copper resistance system multicopper oxidase [Acetobacter fabarum]|uniref:copper resistance system multicopper oxidase n=1 Tax=Acetobacter fabarum TaxID=483199 RepID=UPI002432BE49|nr:copper resistance system multicopper oxidase [Acetobacter fabarum]MCH4026105.1 copper resistance system multicopper oxidase [Acetobacter fabarum]MCH4054853.1 copper resistance system multicopper oxidase [Acetobacter fabarum]MCH4086034.1 copper resistance system multicopper oxidase [Acetobacter fabarum]MCH4127374.1 copper resistance system multicopper oxidase [Acetobacter fabarum]MCH4136723.1 copper resistance system multicopper oxidase [Acetobacter fabarum]
MPNSSLRHGRGIARRQFITGASALAAMATLPATPRAQADTLFDPIIPPNPQQVYDLTISPMACTIAGKTQTIPAMNGSMPGPTLRWREGETVTLNVHNHLAEDTSIHWHGIRCPADMDGVPGLSFGGIAPGRSFTYRFPVKQSGTYWYHSHSNMQEARGLYGAIIIDPRTPPATTWERDYVILLSDWSDVAPHDIMNNLKFQDDYYNFRQRTAVSLVHDAKRDGLGAAIKNRLQWAGMNMSATDISDVTGIIYTYLMNGCTPDTNWTGLFRPNERVRLRFINASSMTFYDIRIPGLQMDVVQADGNDVAPVRVDEFRIGVAETYDCIVQPTDSRAYTIFAQTEDRTGFARGTLAPMQGMRAAIPPMDPRPVRTMLDMGMPSSMQGMDMKGMDMSAPKPLAAHTPPLNVENQNIARMPTDRLADPGDGLRDNGRRVLTYADLRALHPVADTRPPSREITLHLTGNMERYIWGFDGKKFSEAEPIPLRLGERVRFTLINDTMMEHPIHLHGLWSELENGQGAYNPIKHTIIVQPGSKLSYLVSADTPGLWAYHCHLLYHMDLGMFRTVVVS